MSKRILKRMNNDINLFYHHQKDEIKDLCHIQKKSYSYFKPALLFVVVSVILCFQIYQIKQPLIQNKKQSESISLKNNSQNSINKPQSIIGDDYSQKESSYKNDSKDTNIEEKTNTSFFTPQYISVYCLGILDILIIIYILLKRTNKI